MTLHSHRAPVAALAVAGVVAASAPFTRFATSSAAATGTPPRAPGADATWTTGAKQGVGTSTTLESKVWYTLSDGVLSEVYYPRVDVADSRALELVVSDGRTFAENEVDATNHTVELADVRGLVYRQ